jgi:hypothetical protein
MKHVLEAYFDLNPFIRQYAANVVELVLKQGLIHPLQVGVVMCCGKLMLDDFFGAITRRLGVHRTIFTVL